MAKIGKKIESNWSVGTHTVNNYKRRVNDPALPRKRRTSNEIRTIIARSLNKSKDTGKTVDIRSENFKGKDKIRQLYKVSLFKSSYYVLCVTNVVLTVFTEEMIRNDIKKGLLKFPDEEPFEEFRHIYR